MDNPAKPASEPSLRRPAFRAVGWASAWLTGAGFVGLWLCQQVREHQGLSEEQFMHTTGGSLAVYCFSACFILGLLVLFPLSLHLQKRAGVPLPGPAVPGWMACPLRILMVGGFCLLLLILLGLAISSLFHK
ncbi:MAG: hypothetical protein RJA22_2569 [Verrucomicrobiota bacterium]